MEILEDERNRLGNQLVEQQHDGLFQALATELRVELVYLGRRRQRDIEQSPEKGQPFADLDVPRSPPPGPTLRPPDVPGVMAYTEHGEEQMPERSVGGDIAVAFADHL